MIDSLEYNTERTGLIIPEYGRHIQKMVDQAVGCTDKKERNKMAKAIIGVMGNLNPHLRDVADFKHKLWDHLFIMSEHKLDVKSPYPKPKKEEVNLKPELIKNSQGSVKYPHYGSFIISMIREVGAMKEGERKTYLATGIANQMKKNYINWNQSNIMDKFIIKEINTISGGKINLDSETVLATYNFIKPNHNSGPRRKSHSYSRNKKYSN